jgi:hypothetical protein
MLDQLSVHVEEAAGGDAPRREILLAPRALQQVAGLEDGGLGGVVIDDRSPSHDLLG